MTTTPTRGRTPAGIAWGPVAWISILHLGTPLALVFAVRPKTLEYLLPTIGCCTTQGGAIGRGADQRYRHAHSDDEDGVHSPNRSCGWAHRSRWITPDLTAVHTASYDRRRATGRRWEPDMTSIATRLLQGLLGPACAVRPPGPKSAPEFAIVLVPDIPTPCAASTA